MEVEGDETNECTFSSLGLDDRLLKAIGELGWQQPTAIQEKAIPLVLEGMDVVARARTGSGKTAAFLIPIIQKILDHKQNRESRQAICAAVMAPTKELCSQICRHLGDLCRCCSREVRCANLCTDTMTSLLLTAPPDVVVATPSRLLKLLQEPALKLKDTLQFLVIDEADLVFSLGYEADVKAMVPHLPASYQAFLTSATLNTDVKTLKRLLLHNTVTLKLEESQLPSSAQLTQYYVGCSDEDKFVLIYAFLKLGLVRGKSLLFVNNINRCYRLKLFLQQFGIAACVLNAEMPANCRCHIVQQFNDGVYNYIIAADEVATTAHGTDETGGDSSLATRQKRRKLKHVRRDPESGIARGIDFSFVSNVINFDFPRTIDGYIHRVGRTARACNKGTALSFASGMEMKLLARVQDMLSKQPGMDAMKQYQFDMRELEGFRYRATDALRAVTTSAVREARLEEIKAEMFKSSKLKSYFAKNHRDLEALRHDRSLHAVREQQHLRCVPDYIVPEPLKGLAAAAAPKTKRGKRKQQHSASKAKYQKRKDNPLQSFEFSGFNSGDSE